MRDGRRHGSEWATSPGRLRYVYPERREEFRSAVDGGDVIFSRLDGDPSAFVTVLEDDRHLEAYIVSRPSDRERIKPAGFGSP